ncbi:MAG: carbon-nitrogen hydrolase family protein [Leptonema sp. (in: Bacteria)]|nr:carbon-nitrogen hydrolase family protein [Leptonema sp. (in: bacteria)]
MRLNSVIFSSLFAFLLVNCGGQTLSLDEVQQKSPLVPIELQVDGAPTKSILLGFEPYLTQFNYSTEEAFYSELNRYFNRAKSESYIVKDNTVVILPEYLGTWLAVAEEDKSLFAEDSLESAMTGLVTNHIFSFLTTYLFGKSHADDSLKESLFQMKANSMAKIYQSVFSRLASEYGVGIVAGSIVLPHPEVINGRIHITDGPLENVSFFFHSDGSVDSKVSRKIYPTADESPFLAAGQLADNPIYDTPIGKMSTVICADSWYPDVYQSLANVDVVAIPSLITPANSYNSSWPGYSGFDNPKDVDLKDLGNITEKQAWQKYAMSSRIKSTNVKAGMNVFFRGHIFDLDSNGDTQLYLYGKNLKQALTTDKVSGRIYVMFL